MKRTLLAIALLVLFPLLPPGVAGQNTCVTGEWVDIAGATTIRPQVDEYRGRITFSRQPGCPVGCPDSTSSQATFEVLNPHPWLKANFTQTPAPINGSAQPLSARTTQNEVVMTLDRDAPAHTSFDVRVRARCTQTSEVTKLFRVGSFVNVTADVTGAAGIEGGAQWVIRIESRGNVPMTAEFYPRPNDPETGLVWDFPERLWIAKAAEGGADSQVAVTTVSVRGEALPNNLSLTLRLVEDSSAAEDPIEIHLSLPYTVFSGRSTPAMPLCWLALAFVAFARVRHRR